MMQKHVKVVAYGRVQKLLKNWRRRIWKTLKLLGREEVED